MEGDTHGVVVNVTVNDEEGSVAAVREHVVVPRVSQAAGFVSGYWTRKANGGLSTTVRESEEAANAASEMARSVAPECGTVNGVEVREVVASA